MNDLSRTVSAALDGVHPPEVWAGLRPHLMPTRRLRADAIDSATGARVELAAETSQHTGSFKFRAALAAALNTSAPRLLTASSGNLGAALAAAAQRTGKGCTVVMPARSAQVKIAAVQSHGATVELIDTDRVSRQARIAELAAADPAAKILSPYDDPYVICGNATLGEALFSAGEPPEVVLVPVGGGGLSAGLCVAKALLCPSCEVFGAEPLLANDAARSLRAGRIVANEREPDTICDGARSLSLGRRNFEILRELLAGLIKVPEAQVAAAMKLLHVALGLRVEPTGALGLAALLSDPGRFPERRVTCVISGGNVDEEVHARLTG